MKNSLINLFILFLFFTLNLLIGCGNQTNNSTEVSFGGFHAATASTCIVDPSFSGGILVVGKEIGGSKEKFSIMLKDNCDLKGVRNFQTGKTWRFAAYSWSQSWSVVDTSMGVTRCDFQDKYLSPSSSTINVIFLLKSSNCNNSFITGGDGFSQTNHSHISLSNSNGRFPEPNVVFCNTYNEGSGACVGTAPSSYRLSIVNELGDYIFFGCYDVNAPLHLGSIPVLPDMPYVIRTYDLGSCNPSSATQQTFSTYLSGEISNLSFANSIRASGGKLFVANTISTGAVAVTSCPPGYILAPGNNIVNAPNEFCVMKYEAKNVAGVATSQAASSPWTNITIGAAFTACNDLNVSPPTGYATGTFNLISNPEWMALARNIESVSSNWTSGVVGSDCLKQGNIWSNVVCPSDNLAYNYAKGGVDFGTVRADNGTSQLVLDNGNVIWDLSGNVREWVNWNLSNTLSTPIVQANKAHGGSGPLGSMLSFLGITNFPSPLMNANMIKPVNSSLGLNSGIGSYIAGNVTSTGVPTRGGSKLYTNQANGIFSLKLTSTLSTQDTTTGFRCVYRP